MLSQQTPVSKRPVNPLNLPDRARNMQSLVDV
jgi:hypothetical protein